MFTDAFADYPGGVELRAETERLSIEDYWAPSRKSGSFVTNDAAFWMPKECALGQKWGTWLNVKRDYLDDVRLPMTATNVAEVRAAYSDFIGGVGKVCLMPEYMPTEIYNEYAGKALYVEFEPSGTNVVFTAYRHLGVNGNRVSVGSGSAGYMEGRSVSLQADTNTVRVYYGPDVLINAAHGLSDMTNVFAKGVYPHYEVQNNWNTTNAYVLVNEIVCRRLSAFTAPGD
ncbi:MAG: hypothetical protein EOM26_12065 [Alphaproteobacteria bacterium]|nr:hypothetical protein [Alphaproteobacteria bacterium]